MGNGHSYTTEVVYCSLFAQFSLRRNMRYSQLIQDQPPEMLDDSWEERSDVLSDEICSFAKVDVKCISSENCVCVLVIPYFGSLAGRKVHFNVFKDNTIEIKLAGDHHTIQKFDPILCNKDFKLRCLEFAYDSRLQTVHSHDREGMTNKEPFTLAFLCEQTIILNLDTIPMWDLPSSILHSLISSAYQDTVVHTWPNGVAKSQNISLRVKRNIFVKELEWMICHKLSLSSPKQFKLYYNCKHFTSERMFNSGRIHIDCVVNPPQDIACTLHTSPVIALVIIFAGRETFQVNMHLSSQLHELDMKIRYFCDIPDSSFLYIPSVMPSSDVKLYFKQNVSSSRKLLDPVQRIFPMVDHRYNITTKELYSQLPVYKWTIKGLGMTEQLGVTVFEISGPTIPLIFKQCYTLEDAATFQTEQSMQKTSTAVSVNYKWSLDVLLLYISMISGFSGIKGIKFKENCNEILGDSIDSSERLEDIETFQEMVKNLQKKQNIKNIPEITYSET